VKSSLKKMRCPECGHRIWRYGVHLREGVIEEWFISLRSGNRAHDRGVPMMEWECGYCNAPLPSRIWLKVKKADDELRKQEGL
jgi:hypothetical protein